MIIKLNYLLVLCMLVLKSESAIDYVKLLQSNPNLSEDGRLDFEALAVKYVRPAEVHYVITEDRYRLKLYHIPRENGHPCMVVHGSTMDPDSFILSGTNSLAKFLYDQNCDSWFISMRGTIGTDHLDYDKEKYPTRFFNFTFYEQGFYDMNSTLNYILRTTGQDRLLAFGYSIGTSALYTMAAEIPETNNKIIAIISLAPMCYAKNQRGSATLGNNLGIIGSPVLTSIGSLELLGRNESTTYLLQTFCINYEVSYEVCVRGEMFGRFGPDEAGFPPEFSTTAFGHYPAGTTTKHLSHAWQLANRDKFARYDYGPLRNSLIYNSIEPPLIDVKKVTTKVDFIVGKMDYLATAEDVTRLRNELPNPGDLIILPYDNFNHVDFVFGSHVATTFYPFLKDIIKKYI